MTSKDEGLGSSILDAFRYHVPVVATAAGGIPEIVTDGETGLLAQVGNPHSVARCIMRMLEDEDLRQRCMEKSYDLLKKQFTVEKMVCAYENLYREVMGAKCQ